MFSVLNGREPGVDPVPDVIMIRFPTMPENGEVAFRKVPANCQVPPIGVAVMYNVVGVEALYTEGIHRVYTLVDRIHATRNSSREDLRNGYANFLAKIPISLHSSELAFNCFNRLESFK